ncbi:extracellular solute-binding protein [Microbacterium sp.]|uniref:ABC transporter substrate-binding protein n=1 Tax=Microbacterium sp. TaxID=51671 RepID=UPI0033419182
MRRRILATAAAVAGTALMLSACAPSSAPKSDPDQKSGEKVTLKVWSWRTDDIAAYNKIFDVFEKKNPNITVQFEAFQNTEYNQLLSTGLAASDGPDIAQVRSYGQVQANIEAGQLDPLDGKVKGLDEFPENIIASAKGKEDGKIYSVPLATQMIQVFYNKKIFKEQGLKVPTTWDEFIALQDKLLGDKITPFAVGSKEDWILPIVHDIFGSARYGGSEFEKKLLAGETDFNDPDYVASIQLLKDLQKYFPAEVSGVGATDAQVLFASGRAAQYPGLSADIMPIRNLAPDIDMGSYPMPVAPGSVSDKPLVPSWADGNFGLNAKSKNKDAALTLLNWMATPEFGQLVADEIHQFSAVPGVKYDDPVMKEAWAHYKDGSSPYLLLVDFRYGDPFGTAVLGTEIQKLFLGQQTAAGAATALQKGVSTWFTPGK